MKVAGADKADGGTIVAGTDEAGRGSLAGNLVAAAVILDPKALVGGLDDSKKLSGKKRAALYPLICEQALSYAIAEASVEEIDRLNILCASMLAMQRAVEALNVKPALVLVDGNRCPELKVETRAIIGGDAIEPCISAASVLAKVYRDRQMMACHGFYPDYGFDQHKGYPTRLHMERLKKWGPCEIHRRSYAPVQQAGEMALVPRSPR